MDNRFGLTGPDACSYFVLPKSIPKKGPEGCSSAGFSGHGPRIEATFYGAQPISAPRRRGLPPTWRPCEGMDQWTMRMEAYGGPARPSPLLGEALNTGFRNLEVTCAGCDTCNMLDLTIVRRTTEMPIWQLKRRMRCRSGSEERAFRSSVGIWFGCCGPASRRRTMASPGIPKEQRGRHEIASNECEDRVDRGVDGSGFLQR